MEETIRNIWRVPAYLPYLQPELTPEMVADAEERLGVTLPKTYLKLLEQQNGGYIRLTLPQSAHDIIWGIGPNFPNLLNNFWRPDPEEVEEGEWYPKDCHLLIPFDGDGHWYLAFDYRNREPSEEPGITYFDLEYESEMAIAPNFDAFLTLSKEEIGPNEFGIMSDSLPDVARAVETAMGIKFEEPNSDAHGYTVYRCRVGEANPPEWIWLSPNEVPRGFVRASDPRYAELVNRLPGTALRLPQYPEVTVLLSFTEGIANQVKQGCVEASLKFVLLGIESGRAEDKDDG